MPRNRGLCKRYPLPADTRFGQAAELFRGTIPAVHQNGGNHNRLLITGWFLSFQRRCRRPGCYEIVCESPQKVDDVVLFVAREP